MVSINKAIKIIEEVYFNYPENEQKPSILLLGGMGIGKTEGAIQAAKNIAKRLGKEFIRFSLKYKILKNGEQADVREEVFNKIMKNREKYFVFVELLLTQVEPTDLSGVIRDYGEYVDYKQLRWAILLATGAGMLFLDELTIVKRLDMQSVMMKLLLEHIVGFTELSDKVIVVAAGNRPEDTELAEELPEPIMRGRIIKIDVDIPSIEEWINYMYERYEEKWDKRVAVFLKLYPQFFYEEHNRNADSYETYASPRNYTRLSLLSSKIDDEILENIVRGLMSKNASQVFLTFINTEIPDIDNMKITLSDWSKLKIEAKYLLLLQLAGKQVEDIFNKHGYLLDMLYTYERELLTLLFTLMDREKKMRFIEKCKETKQELYDFLLDTIIESKRMGGI